MTYVPTDQRSRLAQRLVADWRALRRRAWQAWHPVESSRAVFLVGSGRSGTDLVVEHLSLSPELDIFNESHPRAFENWRLRDRDTIRSLVNSSRARCVLFKPIVETHKARTMLDIADDSRLLFCFRNPADTINSMVRFFPQLPSSVRKWADSLPGADYPPNATESLRHLFLHLYRPECSVEDLAALSWLVRNRLYLELGLSDISTAMLVDYDLLVEDPRAHFRSICHFIDISYIEGMEKGVSSSSRGKNPPPVVRGDIMEACNETWHLLKSPRIAPVSAVAQSAEEL